LFLSVFRLAKNYFIAGLFNCALISVRTSYLSRYPPDVL